MSAPFVAKAMAAVTAAFLAAALTLIVLAIWSHGHDEVSRLGGTGMMFLILAGLAGCATGALWSGTP